MSQTVLVTGGSGFIGVHSILQLLAAGHQVRTTIRNWKLQIRESWECCWEGAASTFG